MPFSRGTRNCLGKPSAQGEIYMSLARIIRNFARLERDENGIVKVVSGISCMRLIEGIPILGTILAFRLTEKGRGNVRIIFK